MTWPWDDHHRGNLILCGGAERVWAALLLLDSDKVGVLLLESLVATYRYRVGKRLKLNVAVFNRSSHQHCGDSPFWTTSGFLILLKDTWDLTSDLRLARCWDDVRFFLFFSFLGSRFLDLLHLLSGYFRPGCGPDCDLQCDCFCWSMCPDVLMSFRWRFCTEMNL